MSTLSDYPVIYDQSVAWGDMDAFGHVNNVMYYRYIAKRSAFLYGCLEYFCTGCLYSGVLRNQCKYISPLFIQTESKIGVRVEEIRNSAFRMSYLLWSESQQKTVAMAEAVIVCVNKHNMLKTEIPEIIRHKITEIELSVKHLILN